MIFYAHRGNVDGVDLEMENKPVYILEAIDRGFSVEIDVHFVDGIFYLGHDEPTYEVNEHFLENPNVICHAKSSCAFMEMLKNQKIHSFWNDKDLYALTSKNFIWTLDDNTPRFSDFHKMLNPIISRRIFCKPDFDSNLAQWHYDTYYGICSDYVGNIKLDV